MLTFHLFGMPVTVRGSFLFIAALIGFVGVADISRTIAWIVIVFVSILIHELGHAVTARMFGSEVAIELNGLGGLTRWSIPEGQLTPGRRALIAAAGSATGLVFGAIVWLLALQVETDNPLIGFALTRLVYVNVFWGLLNWLPIRPLDGGHLLESLLEKVAPKRAEMIARVIFTATAAAALALAIWQDMIFIAVLAGWLLLSELNIGSRSQPRPAGGLPTLSYDDPGPDPEGEAAEEPVELPDPVEVPDPDEPEDSPHQ